MSTPKTSRWAWRKSSRSTGNGQCVEMAFDCDRHVGALRDSKNPEGPALVVPAETLTAFVAAAKLGKLDPH
ncbi:DUF397 domain-containing protein [Streptoalloteichus hindustanus]|uniref:DUF397 domain-containing protein n=1 Tax=Streptoalloteichus hindustanus TaxID=2017 RepID=A0A1M5DAI6_STRHI|nr:DUF397 domain-containing protein [Streptoalloteichus hindustanus]SHF64006.1 protein of unknown function [Streptoalloteichus hindustanus]